MKNLLHCLMLSLLCSASFAYGQQNHDDVVIRAMKDELARSMAKLQLLDMGKPYFISYEVDDTTVIRISATLGQLTGEDVSRERKLKPQVRVGDFTLDNTSFVNLGGVGLGEGNCGCHTTLPLDDDYDQIRHEVWLETDAAYKQAAAEFAAKRSALEHRQHGQELADFTPQAPVTSVKTPQDLKIEVAGLKQLARQLSEAFHDSPEITSSSVEISAGNTFVRFVDSEGAVITRQEPEAVLEIHADTQADDGPLLTDSFRIYAATPAGFGAGDLLDRTRKFIAELKLLKEAKTLEPYNGPVLFEGEAAPEVVEQVFAAAVVGLRIPISTQPEFEARFRQALSQFGASLADHVGSRVMPNGFDLINDPTVDHVGEAKLLGSYSVDDEAVPSRQVKIIENGRLTNLLGTRTPTPQTKASTGSSRGLGGAPGNLFLTSRDAVSNEELRKELLKAAQERGYNYGIVVRRLSAASPNSLARLSPFLGGSQGSAIAVYKLFSDGHEEMVRAELDAVPLTAFKDLMGAGNTQVVYHSSVMPFGGSLFAAKMGGTTPMVSLVVPSLLFDELSLKPLAEAAPKPPVVPSPLALGAKR